MGDGAESSDSSTNGNTAQNQSKFDFEDWAKEVNLNRKTTQVLRSQDCICKESLKLLTEEDIGGLGLTLGQRKLLVAAIKRFHTEQAQNTGILTSGSNQDQISGNTSTSVSGPESQTATLSNVTIRDINQQTNSLNIAGEQFDSIFKDIVPSDDLHSRSTVSYHIADPRTTLTVKAQGRKAVHITDFLSEQARKKLRNRRKDLVLTRQSEADDTLIVRTDDRHPYSGISVDEWSAANTRVLNKLLSSGDLKRDQIEYYLAYTATVMDFVAIYDWASVLNFDYQYREQQAAHNFMWGCINPLMEFQLLVPRQQQSFQANTHSRMHSSNEECRQWKATNGHCRFGERCRYKHIPLQNHNNSSTTWATNGPKNGQPPVSNRLT